MAPGGPTETAGFRAGTPAVPLSMVQAGRTATIVGVCGGGGMVRRLADMGLIRGASLMVLNNAGAGPLLVRVGESRVMLGRGVTRAVMVT